MWKSPALRKECPVFNTGIFIFHFVAAVGSHFLKVGSDAMPCRDCLEMTSLKLYELDEKA